MTLPSAELAQLRASAEQGMHEDASPVHAAARERLLQLYRDCMVDFGHFDLSGRLKRGDPCGEEDIGGIEWIARLAATGHVPAGALLDRALDERRLSEMIAAAPERMAGLTLLVPPLARREAFEALGAQHTDYHRLERVLDAGGAICRPVAEALRALIAHAAAPGDRDRALLALQPARLASGDAGAPGIRRELLTQFATWRLASGDEPERAAGQRLLALAGQADPRLGATLAWIGQVAAEAPQFMRAWFDGNPDPLKASKLARLTAGVAFDTGGATGAPDLAEASRWYAFAIDGTPEAGGEGGAGNPKLCYAVAKQIEIQLLRAHPELMPVIRAWYERGVALGEERCIAALGGSPKRAAPSSAPPSAKPAAPLGAIKLLSGAEAGKETALCEPLTSFGRPGVQLPVLTRREQGYFLIHVEGVERPRINERTLGAAAHALADRDVIEIDGVRMEFFLKR